MSTKCESCHGDLGPTPIPCSICNNSVYCSPTCSSTPSLHATFCTSLQNFQAQPTNHFRAIQFPRRDDAPRFVWLSHLTTSISTQLVPNTQDIKDFLEPTPAHADGPFFEALPTFTCQHCGIEIEVYCLRERDRTSGDIGRNKAFMSVYDGLREKVWRGGLLARGFARGGTTHQPRNLETGCAIEVVRVLKEQMEGGEN